MLVITILSNNYNYMYFLLRNIYSWQPKMIINYIINYITIQIITITIMINYKLLIIILIISYNNCNHFYGNNNYN